MESKKMFTLEKEVNIGLANINLSDANSWYRSAAPMEDLARRCPQIKLKYIQTPAWNDISQADIMYFARPYGSTMRDAVKEVVQMGKHVWIDQDDDVFGVLPSNPVYMQYSNNQPEREATTEMLSHAGLLTVSTVELVKRYHGICQNIFHIPNCLDMEWYGRVKLPPKPKRKKPVIFWRGSPSHIENLLYWQNDFIELSKEMDAHFIFQGQQPWAAKDIKGLHFLGITPVPLCFIIELGVFPDVHVVAMKDTAFDRCRSHIAWLETNLCGAVCVAPDFPEWIRPGVVNYNPNEKWAVKKAVEYVLSLSQEDRDELNQLGRKEILSKYTLEAAATPRINFIRQMIQYVKGIEVIPSVFDQNDVEFKPKDNDVIVL